MFKTGITDEALMLAVKKGELSQLTELFDRYHEKIYRFFLRLTYQHDISEDLTQQVFCRILKYRHSYKEGHNYFRPWIYQLARNLYYDHREKDERYNKQFSALTPGMEQIHEPHDTYTEEHYIRLEKAIMLLDVFHREIVVLRCYHQLPYEEIAAVTNKSEPAIRVQLHRAIRTLRKFYFQEN